MANAVLYTAVAVLLILWRLAASKAKAERRKYGELFWKNREDCAELDERIKALEISRDYYAGEAESKKELSETLTENASKHLAAMEKSAAETMRLIAKIGTLRQERDHAKLETAQKIAHCGILERQVATMQQELNDVHAKATDLIERLDLAKKACDHPYGGRATADAE